jgi:hypothetical protein
MADSSITLPGTGTPVDTRTVGTDHRQVMVIGDPATVGGVAPVDAVNGLTVQMAATSPGIITTGTQAAPSTQYISTVAAGDLAHDAADSGNPQKIGGVARSSEPAAVSASGDRVNAIFDLVGKQIVLPYANPENFFSASPANVTTTTSTLLIASPGAGLRYYITQITVSNKHLTAGTDVLIQDGNGGATLYAIPAASLWGGAVLTFPTPLRQPTVATALYFAAAAAADIRVSVSGYKGV